MCQGKITWATDLSCSPAIFEIASAVSGSPLCPGRVVSLDQAGNVVGDIGERVRRRVVTVGEARQPA